MPGWQVGHLGGMRAPSQRGTPLAFHWPGCPSYTWGNSSYLGPAEKGTKASGERCCGLSGSKR